MLGFGGFREGITDAFYANPTELLQELARIIRTEIEAAIADGAAYIQLDAPNYPMRFCDQRLRQQWVEQGIDVESELDEALAADQACVEGIDRKGAVLAFHVCRGNNQSRWQADGGYEPIAEKMFSLLDVDRYLLEYDTDRAGGFEPLRYMPKGTAVVLGLVTTKEAPLEPQDTLMRRIEEASRYLDIGRPSPQPPVRLCLSGSGQPHHLRRPAPKAGAGRGDSPQDVGVGGAYQPMA